MSVFSPDEPEQVAHDPVAIALALARMEHGLEDQERRIRTAINGFSIFALLAVLISLGTLIAVATKLQAKSSTKTVTVATRAPAAPPVLPSAVGIGLREYTITPTSARAKAGKVTFNVRNG